MPIERVNLGAGDWVDLKAVLVYGDRAAIQQKLFASGAEVEGGINLRSGNLELLERSIADWGGPGFCLFPAHPHDGECLARPINSDSLEGLDETAERILLEIRARQLRGSPDFTRPPWPTTSTAARAGSTSGGSETSGSSN